MHSQQRGDQCLAMLCTHADHVIVLAGVARHVKGDIRRKNSFAGPDQFNIICRR
jgi:hypothetical protein